MTTTWLALAAAIGCAWVPESGDARLGALAAHGRLASLATHRRAARRIHWSRVIGIATAAAAAGVVLTAGLVLGIAVAAAGWTAARLARELAHRRAATDAQDQLVRAVRVLVGELEAGSRPAAALLAAADTAPRYAATLHAAAVGAAGSGDAAGVLCHEPDTRMLGLAWRLGADSGAALAGVLARVAAELAAVHEQRRTVTVALAGPRSSAAVLACLPLLGIGLGALLGARPWAFLLGSDAGHLVAGIGVLLDLAGLMWMRAILRRAERLW